MPNPQQPSLFDTQHTQASTRDFGVSAGYPLLRRELDSTELAEVSRTGANALPRGVPASGREPFYQLPPDLSPRHRLQELGASYLTTAELLSLTLGSSNNLTGIHLAEQLLRCSDGLHGLARLSYTELTTLAHIGPARAAAIQAMFELAKRMATASRPERLTIRSPADLADHVMLDMSLLEREELRVALLNTKNELFKLVTVYAGSLNTAVVRIGEVFRAAIRHNAAFVILLHNHPSGDPTPSPEDVRVTEMIVEAGQLLDLPVLDHLIIGLNRYVSLKERGLGFKT